MWFVNQIPYGFAHYMQRGGETLHGGEFLFFGEGMETLPFPAKITW